MTMTPAVLSTEVPLRELVELQRFTLEHGVFWRSDLAQLWKRDPAFLGNIRRCIGDRMLFSISGHSIDAAISVAQGAWVNAEVQAALDAWDREIADIESSVQYWERAIR